MKRFDLSADPVLPASLLKKLEGREVENIPITPAIQHRQMMAGFPNANLALVPVEVKKVCPCPNCGAPTVWARVGHETKLLDAFENPFSPRYWSRWEADPVIGDHHCGVGRKL
jgi:hypothetical protein